MLLFKFPGSGRIARFYRCIRNVPLLQLFLHFLFHLRLIPENAVNNGRHIQASLFLQFLIDDTFCFHPDLKLL